MKKLRLYFWKRKVRRIAKKENKYMSDHNDPLTISSLLERLKTQMVEDQVNNRITGICKSITFAYNTKKIHQGQCGVLAYFIKKTKKPFLRKEAYWWRKGDFIPRYDYINELLNILQK